MKKRELLPWLVAIFTTLSLGFVWAAESDDARKMQFQIPSVSRTVWLKEMLQVAESEACSENSYFRVCFSLSEHSCKGFLQKQSSQCANSIRLPANLSFNDNEPSFANRFALCLTESFRSNFKNKFVHSQECTHRGSFKK